MLSARLSNVGVRGSFVVRKSFSMAAIDVGGFRPSSGGGVGS